MGVFNAPDKTKEELILDIVRTINTNNARALNGLKKNAEASFKLFWNPGNNIRIQEISDSYGTDASTLFWLSSITFQLIKSIEPSYIIPTPGSFTPNNDGTVSIAPEILLQPSSLTLPLGSEAGLVLSVYSKDTPTYQWKKDGVEIDGATNESYVIASLSEEDVGSYVVEITNSGGTTTSNVATISIGE